MTNGPLTNDLAAVSITSGNKKGQDSINAILSSLVGATGHISNFLIPDLISVQ